MQLCPANAWAAPGFISMPLWANRGRICYPRDSCRSRTCRVAGDRRQWRGARRRSCGGFALRGGCVGPSDPQEGQLDGTTRIQVEVREPVTKHVVTVMQIQRWLDGATQSPNERVKKDRLKRLLAER